MQSMIKAAVDLGFNESEAELLVNQTFMGSVAIKIVIPYPIKNGLLK